MNRIASTSILLLLAASLASPALAQGHDRPGRRGGSHDRGRSGEWRRIDSDQLRHVADRLERDTDALESSLDRSLDESRLDGTNREDRLNEAAGALEDAADRLGKRVDDRQEARHAADEVFDRARELDQLVGGARLDSRTRRDWRRVDADLAALAAFFPRLADRDEWDRSRHRSSGDWRDWDRRD